LRSSVEISVTADELRVFKFSNAIVCKKKEFGSIAWAMDFYIIASGLKGPSMFSCPIYQVGYSSVHSRYSPSAAAAAVLGGLYVHGPILLFTITRICSAKRAGS